MEVLAAAEIDIMDITEKILVYKEIKNLIKKVANRWASFCGYGYQACDVELIDNQIFFKTRHYDGVFVLDSDSISTKYLLDDSNLELDALDYYKTKANARNKEFLRKQALENHPIVLEYKKMNQDMLRLNTGHLTIL